TSVHYAVYRHSSTPLTTVHLLATPLSTPFDIIFQGYYTLRDLHSFPTRRSSDLLHARHPAREVEDRGLRLRVLDDGDVAQLEGEDRKSTRLNSSHVAISYACFCLEKKMRMCRDVGLWFRADEDIWAVSLC